jgi:hypothetical protein
MKTSTKLFIYYFLGLYSILSWVYFTNNFLPFFFDNSSLVKSYFNFLAIGMMFLLLFFCLVFWQDFGIFGTLNRFRRENDV